MDDKVVDLIFDKLKSIENKYDEHTKISTDNQMLLNEIKSKVYNGMSTNIQRTVEDIKEIKKDIQSHRDDFKKHISEELVLIETATGKATDEHESEYHLPGKEKALAGLIEIWKHRGLILKLILVVLFAIGVMLFVTVPLASIAAFIKLFI